MKIAIHHREGSFSDYWIEWCKQHDVQYKLVNAYESDIATQLKDCDGFLWHWHHNRHADQLIARQITLALETAGKSVFPNVNTAWHFDDKIGQKYLLETVGLPLVPTYIFYDKTRALSWLKTAVYPLVFKLSRGSGSTNVQFIRNYHAAKRLVNRAFNKGFQPVSLFSSAKQQLWIFRRDKKYSSLIRAVYLLIAGMFGAKTKASIYRLPEIGYVYFQDFVPNNRFDDRLVVVGDRCFCLRRQCRKNDFRASGSGLFSYDHTIFPTESIKLAFSVAKNLKMQCVAMDIVYDVKGNPLIVEISYGFATGSAYENCDGYFDPDLKWHDKKVTPQIFMIEDFHSEIIARLSTRNAD